jgi:hypothetical protein
MEYQLLPWRLSLFAVLTFRKQKKQRKNEKKHSFSLTSVTDFGNQ